jgi:hypothetical protein
MTREEEFVVNPLIDWFQRQKAPWKLYRPKYGTAATGWDLEARRKNQDLLIEAKYIAGPFLSSFTGLVTAPLARRPQHFMATKYRSWSYGICWAIGAAYDTRNVYQILLDYFSRNPRFWRHYHEDLRLLYIFFVKEGKVAKVRFPAFLSASDVYAAKTLDKNLIYRRAVADDLMKQIKYT